MLCNSVQLKLAIPLKLQTNFADVVVSFDAISVVSVSSVGSGYVLGHVSLEVLTYVFLSHGPVCHRLLELCRLLFFVSL